MQPSLTAFPFRDINAELSAIVVWQDSSADEYSGDEIDDQGGQQMDEMVRDAPASYAQLFFSKFESNVLLSSGSFFTQAFLRPWGADGSAPPSNDTQDEVDAYMDQNLQGVQVRALFQSTRKQAPTIGEACCPPTIVLTEQC